MAVLKAYSIASEGGHRAVDAEHLGRLLKFSPSTAALNNNFFLESGLLVREGKGKYLPVDEVHEFRRLETLGDESAGSVLAPLLEKTWYAQALRQRDEMGPFNRAEAIRVLADSAGADNSFIPQLHTLMEWLEFVGLVETGDDGIVTIETSNVAQLKAMPTHDTGPGAGDSVPVTTTPTPVRQDRAVVLSWSFQVQLTADDLAALTPDQIKAVFEAAGTVAAVRPPT